MEDLKKPLVSILIPTYNRRNSVVKSIESALSQTYDNIEIIISDSGSTDGTLDKINEKFPASVENNIIKIFKPEEGITFQMFENWNNCMKQAKGKYLKFIFSDDYIDKNFLEDGIKFLEDNEDIAMLATTMKMIDSNGETICFHRRNSEGLYDGNKMITRSLKRRNVIGAPTNSIYRHSTVKDRNIEFINNPVHLDWIFEIDLIRDNLYYYIDKPLAYFLSDSDNVTNSIKFSSKWIENNSNLKLEYMNLPFISRLDKVIIKINNYLYSTIVLALIKGKNSIEYDKSIKYLKSIYSFNLFFYKTIELVVRIPLIKNLLLRL